jgi:superkiller protein 3
MMAATSIPLPAGGPSRGSLLRIGIGGFVFLLVFLGDLFHQFPLLTVVFGLAGGAVALWGAVEIALWLMEQMDQPDETGDDPAEHLPPAPIDGLTTTDVSFGDLEKDFSPLPPPQEELFTSMVAESPEPVSPPPPPLPPAGPGNSGDTLEPEPPAPVPSRPRNTQSLLQFLDEGIAEEIDLLNRKLEKSPRNYSLMLKLSQLHEERGEISNALEIMQRCVALNPENPDVFLFYGMLLRKAGESAKSRDAIKQALSLNRFLSKAFYQLGVLERQEKNYPDAKEAFQKSIQLAPDDAYAHYQLGMVYWEAGDVERGQMELKRAVLLNPNDSYGYSRLGQIFQQTHQWEQAIQAYSQALSLKSKDAFVLERLGEVLSEKGDFEKARDIFQEALANQFHPEIRTLNSLGKALMRLGKFTDLRPVAEEILRLKPNSEDALYYLALCQIQAQEPRQALTTLSTLTKHHPEKWEAWVEMGKLHQSLDEPDQALSAYLKAAPSASDQAGIWNTIGIMLSNKKDFEGALKAFRKAVSFDYTDAQIQGNFKAVRKKVEAWGRKIIDQMNERLAKDPKDLPAYLELGRAFEILEKPEDALMAYQRLLAIKPDDVPGLMAYGLMLRSRGKLRMAVRCFKEIRKLRPDHLEAGLQLVTAFLSLGFLNEALHHAAIVQKGSPDDPRIHFLLGKIYFTKGMAPRALKEFTFVVQKSADPDMVGWAELMRRRLARSL